ncbi:MAG TPA: MTAP family purine nucleoside phosphorylase [Thermoplasmata archaeon]
MAPSRVGIIGGSALGDAFALEEEQAKFLVTPHGAPSDPPRIGKHGALTVAFLPRHGHDHRIPPHKLNHRANLWAFKELGVTRILATSSTGSLKETIRPGTFVVPDDFVSYWDIPTYYDERVVHAMPSLDEGLRNALVAGARDAKATVRARGVYVQTTGPRLETRAEIAHFKSIGDVVGMTIASEATLASELGIPYAALCTVDNFANGIVDEPLTFERIRETQRANADLTKSIVVNALGHLG